MCQVNTQLECPIESCQSKSSNVSHVSVQATNSTLSIRFNSRKVFCKSLTSKSSSNRNKTNLFRETNMSSSLQMLKFIKPSTIMTSTPQVLSGFLLPQTVSLSFPTFGHCPKVLGVTCQIIKGAHHKNLIRSKIVGRQNSFMGSSCFGKNPKISAGKTTIS